MEYLEQATIDELHRMLDKSLDGYNSVQKHFMTQYSYFELNNDIWTLHNLLDIGKEVVKVIRLEITESTTNIAVHGTNPKYTSVIINKLLDTRNGSHKYKIYAPDLFEEFQPCHYVGHVRTG